MILDHDDHLIWKEVRGCTQASWRLSDQMRAFALNYESLVSQSVTYAGIELLRQLKKVQNVSEGDEVTDLGPSLKKTTIFFASKYSKLKNEKTQLPFHLTELQKFMLWGSYCETCNKKGMS